mgnify:CR=1 FL=1
MIKNHLKKLNCVFWSQTIRSFYTELSIENIKIVFNHLKSKNWSVDFQQLKKVFRHYKSYHEFLHL